MRARTGLRLAGGALLVALWLGASPGRAQTAQADFDRLAAAGRPALALVETFPEIGRQHVDTGVHVAYPTDPPTGGNRWPDPVPPGAYRVVLPAEMLVHSLEHGNIVIYYDQPGTAALNQLLDWATLFRGPWDGLVIAPRPGAGTKVILTAWGHRLALDTFDAAAAAAFTEAFRGRGPENPVR